MPGRAPALAAIALLAMAQPVCLALALDTPAATLSPGQDLWTKEIGASACAKPEQTLAEIDCTTLKLKPLEHIKIIGQGVYHNGMAYCDVSPDQCSYYEFARDDGTHWFLPLMDISRFYTDDPRTMAEREARESSSGATDANVGREFWRTDDFSPITVCMTRYAAIVHDPELCRAPSPGTHWRIVKVGKIADNYNNDSISDGYYLVQSDDNAYGYIKQTDVGIPNVEGGLPGSLALSLGIAWEDPRITAAKIKVLEARASAECKRRGGVRIGMSRARVLASCWGTPTKRIETILAHATREKWVYSDREAFLYFDNGVLTRIRYTR